MSSVEIRDGNCNHACLISLDGHLFSNLDQVGLYEVCQYRQASMNESGARYYTSRVRIQPDDIAQCTTVQYSDLQSIMVCHCIMPYYYVILWSIISTIYVCIVFWYIVSYYILAS